jgi:hypothetical protein
MRKRDKLWIMKMEEDGCFEIDLGKFLFRKGRSRDTAHQHSVLSL